MIRAALLASTALLLAPPPASAAGAPVPNGDALVLKRILLSTGGVGYFEYEARVTGDAALSLEVRRDQVDDVLKSIVVYDDRGGVGTIGLPGAEPLETAFRELPFSLDDLASPAALLNALKGAEIRTGGARELTGRLLSVTEETVQRPNGSGDESRGGAAVTRHRISLMTADGLRQLVLEDADALRFTDPRVQAQLDAALSAVADHSRRERRRLTLRTTGGGEGERSLRVAYVAATPLWKATYRLSLPGKDPDGRRDGKDGGGNRGALQGWAVLENLSGEDWREVDLTVVSGNPVTLRQALYTPYFVERPEVPVEVLGRVLPTTDEGGVLLDRSRAAAQAEAAPPRAAAAGAPAPVPSMAPMAKAAPFAPPPPPPPQAAALQSAEASAAEGAQVLFRYPQPVSVPNGGTLMMPIAVHALPAERIALYQPGTEPRHPLAALRLRNDSGTALPPGLLTFYETVAPGTGTSGGTGGAAGLPAYVGDARMATLPAGDSRLLSFAVDQAVTVDRAERPSRSLTRATVADGILLLSVTDRQTTLYTVSGAADGDRALVIEHPRRPGWDLAAPADAATEATAGAYRLPLAVPAGKTATLTAVLERPRQERILLSDLTADQLTVQAAAQELPPPVREALTRLAAQRAAVADKDRRIADVEREQSERIKEQERLRANLAALPTGSDLHKRTLAKMGEAENRLDALSRDLTAARAEAEAARQALREQIRGLAL